MGRLTYEYIHRRRMEKLTRECGKMKKTLDYEREEEQEKRREGQVSSSNNAEKEGQ